MKKIALFSCIVSVTYFIGTAQSVAINETGTAPDTSAIFDVSSTTKGLLVPRMTMTNMNAIAGPAKGLLVYNTTNNQFWTNIGTAGSPNWRNIASNAWNLVGNAGTNAGTHFIGTTDNQPLVFKTNNVFSGTIDPIDFNVVLGFHAGESLTTAEHNVVLGAYALQDNTTGSNCIAIGDSSLYAFNSLNGRNIAIGFRAGRNASSGTYNCFMGMAAGYGTTIGFSNTAIGNFALNGNTMGSNNLAIGTRALNAATTYSKNIAIGDSAMYTHSTGMENTVIGHKAMSGGSNNFYSTYLGYKAGLNSNAGIFNVGIGYGTMSENGGDYNVAIGTAALANNDNGNYNVAIGYSSLWYNTTGEGNLAIGDQALWQNETGSNNIAIGNNALKSNDTPNRNVAIGDSSLYDLEGGSGENTVIGASAGMATTNGNNNSFYGNQAAYMNTTGDANVAIGNRALFATTIADGNTAVGRIAGDAFDLGSNNTLIGGFTDVNASGFTESTALGYNAAITASNQVRVGISTTGSIGGFQNFSNISDGRYKKNIQQNVHGLDFILQLNPVTYNLDIHRLEAVLPSEIPIDETLIQKSESEVRTGFIAQEVEAAAHSLGYEFSGVDAPKNDTDLYGLRYAEFVVPLVKAVQEQQAQIELLKQQNSELLDRIESLEKR